MKKNPDITHIHFDLPKRTKAAYVKQAARDGGTRKLIDWIFKTLDKGLDDDLKINNKEKSND